MMSGDPYTIRVPVIIEVTGSGRDEDDLTARLTAALNATEDLDYPLRAGEFFIRAIEPDPDTSRPWTITPRRPA
jgi:hypothetical protein